MTEQLAGASSSAVIISLMATPDSLESNTYNTSDEQKTKEQKEAFHLPTHPKRCSCQGRRHEKATRAPSTGTSLTVPPARE